MLLFFLLFRVVVFFSLHHHHRRLSYIRSSLKLCIFLCTHCCCCFISFCLFHHISFHSDSVFSMYLFSIAWLFSMSFLCSYSFSLSPSLTLRHSHILEYDSRISVFFVCYVLLVASACSAIQYCSSLLLLLLLGCDVAIVNVAVAAAAVAVVVIVVLSSSTEKTSLCVLKYSRCYTVCAHINFVGDGSRSLFSIAYSVEFEALYGAEGFSLSFCLFLKFNFFIHNKINQSVLSLEWIQSQWTNVCCFDAVFLIADYQIIVDENFHRWQNWWHENRLFQTIKSPLNHKNRSKVSSAK